MNSHVITPGPYRATKLWNEVTRLFRAGMPLKKHRHNFRHHSSCFTASAAVDWLHQLLRDNNNFGPDVTRQQTVQLLKKFLKNHVIEDVKGRFGSEDLEDNTTIYRFPTNSPLKPIPCSEKASSSIKKRSSLRDRDGFFKFRSIKRQEKETQENVDPAFPLQREENHPPEEQQTPRRELTEDDERDIWRDITLTHLQRILGVSSLGDVLDQRCVNPQNIIHNMTKVNKQGIVTLEDKTNDLPHWVLSAMKSLASWPKYDSAQPSYPGFERDVFKTVSDYFYSLPQPLLTFELYELFINVLVFCGYAAVPAAHQLGKRKKVDLPSNPPPAKSSFRSTECLLLSLLRHGACEEAESPMSEVIGGKLQSRRLAALDGDRLGGSCISIATAFSNGPQTRSCSMETVLDDSAPLTRQQLFLSNDSLASCSHSNRTHGGPHCDFNSTSGSKPITLSSCDPAATARNRLSVRPRPLRPRSIGSCLDIVVEAEDEDAKEPTKRVRANSFLTLNTAGVLVPLNSSLSSHSAFSRSSSCLSTITKVQESDRAGGSRPRPASSTANLWTLPPPAVVRRCLSSVDVSKLSRPVSMFKAPVQTKPDHSVLQPHRERIAIEALQLCTLLLPPASRRKLQLLMRMLSRISQNVDMPRLHPAIGTRTLMVHTFSGCILGSAEEGDLDELLATRLVSFLLDHQQSILAVPQYLLSAINDHVQYLRSVQVPVDSVPSDAGDDPVCVPMPIYAFCRQISGAEFEQQKMESSQKAMEELLEILLTDQNMSEKERNKKLKQFQKQYPDIYRRRFPSSERKPKIKPPLISLKKTKAFSLRN
ncbi:DEP domain-containing protein 1A [Gouania willdenowi]|uniref:DEP domain-containing protein 1A-like n=1 Tax=Gouania willdenowi TaxID=441366 RepID=A0A8C5D766_GOUWI|nr:DEP domain-containing protein 1A-like [Gouania willdenowi]